MRFFHLHSNVVSLNTCRIQLFHLMIQYKPCQSTLIFQLEILIFPWSTAFRNLHFLPSESRQQIFHFLYTLIDEVVSFTSSYHSSCSLIIFKCNWWFASHIISLLLQPSINCMTLPWAHSVLKTPLFARGWGGMKKRGQQRTVVYVTCCTSTPAQAVAVLPPMRRSNIDSTPNKPVTLPHI